MKKELYEHGILRMKIYLTFFIISVLAYILGFDIIFAIIIGVLISLIFYGRFRKKRKFKINFGYGGMK